MQYAPDAGAKRVFHSSPLKQCSSIVQSTSSSETETSNKIEKKSPLLHRQSRLCCCLLFPEVFVLLNVLPERNEKEIFFTCFFSAFKRTVCVNSGLKQYQLIHFP